MNDYYGILGLSRGCSAEEVKTAYRKASRAHHPDIVGHTAKAEEKFKEINAAYEVLSDPKKREMYDLGVDPLAPGGGAAGGAGNPFAGFGSQGFGGGFAGFGDIFEAVFTAASGGSAGQQGPLPRAARGRDQLERLTVDLSDAVFGATRAISYSTYLTCSGCGGSCCAPGTGPSVCSACQGRGVRERLVRSLLGTMRTMDPCRQCEGHGTVIATPCPDCSGNGRVRGRRSAEVRVPAGVDTGNRLRLTGEGEAGPAGGPAADLYVEFKVRRHADFMRDGDDLVATLALPMTAAALGASVPIQTLDGVQQITIRPGAQPGSTIVLEGLGVGRLGQRTRGDLRVNLDVQVPTDLDEAQRELLGRLAAERGEERPQAELSPAHGGMFSRLKDKLSGR
ncbi:MAG: DnaJ domain-containing protein [Bifidobacteriaceae bacterium]|jgi:molecular chaperone DnaJ|nr:DnaJ domain-containing protein [Bifidobacteriaceae bacterium]